MTRPSPSTQRVIAILNFFAEHPDQLYSLTDLVRSLDINRATCHSLLAELVEANYLYRTNDKRYLIGPAMARLGMSANRQLSPLEMAIPEMRALADAHDVICAAVFPDKGEALIRELAIPKSHLRWLLLRGSRWPLRPPFAAVFLASWSDANIEAWMNKVKPEPTALERSAMRDSVAFVREHGFQLIAEHPSKPTLDKAIEWMYQPGAAQPPIAPLTSLRDDPDLPLAGISAPVLDEKGRTEFVISLSGFLERYSGAQAFAIAEELRSACAGVTDFIRKFARTETERAEP